MSMRKPIEPRIINDLRHAFAVWSRLRAWKGASFKGVRLWLLSRKWRRATGTADASVIFVGVGSDAADAFATLLHEMAHTALARKRRLTWNLHGPTWRRLFLGAAAEVLGRPVDHRKGCTRWQLDQAVRDAFARRLCFAWMTIPRRLA